jgi:transcriptional regulator with XRE-family HTH domain
MHKNGGFLMATLYESIKSLCDEAKITPGKMCVDLEVSKSMMTKLKNGTKQSIQVETAQKIADYFGVSVDRVLGSEQKEKSPTPDGAGLDKATIELKSIWDTADDDEKAALLEMARLIKKRRGV